MRMCDFLQKLSWPGLLLFVVVMALLPFQPAPHLWEKWQMFRNGTLTRPLDIFDVFWHLWPTLVVALKFYCGKPGG